MKKIAVRILPPPKPGRFLRLPPALETFTLEQAQANGFRSPQEYITALIRREFQNKTTLAKAA